MTENIEVVKRNGTSEPLNLNKIHQVLEWAVDGLSGVYVSQIEMKSSIQLYDGITSKEIHETLVKTAADLISETSPNYQYVSARLAVFNIRKEAYGKFTPPPLLEHIKKLTEKGLYDSQILVDYSEDEINELDTIVDHSLDLTLAYSGVKQLEGKYLVQDRVLGKVFESPQMINILVPMCLFSSYPKDTRLGYVKRFYSALSTFKISLPTPIMGGVRTPTRQFSSCVVIESADTLDSIKATGGAIIDYVSRKAGIGINAGAIRAVGSNIRGGEAVHTGIVPFLKLFQASVKSCSQGGIRGGAATVFYPLWHLEAESLLVLKNNRGVDDNRVRQMDYGVQINKTLYTRLLKNQDITLFSPDEVPGLYDAFFNDQDKFEELYVKYEQDDNIRKKTVPAYDLFSSLMQERASTGRIYIQNIDHCNTHSSFIESVAPIKQSNLCMEITLPTKPISKDESVGEIALCTLAAINLGKLDNLHEDMEELCDLLVRALDELLTYQDYPLESAKRPSLERRMLGIGVINYAYYLAKNGVRYSDKSANELTHRTFESLQYHLLKASNKLAMERGACSAFSDTKYSKGILPIDTYKSTVDQICSTELELDWEELRSSILEHGLRNSTLSSQMPAETSAQVSNSTNGIEPPRGLVSVKASKDGILKQIVPEIDNPDVKYELLWEIPDNSGYLELVSIMQKFIDQSLSANTNYDPSKFSNGRVPMKVLINDLLTAYKLGIKTLYYHNTRDGANEYQEPESGCDSGSCSI